MFAGRSPPGVSRQTLVQHLPTANFTCTRHTICAASHTLLYSQSLQLVRTQWAVRCVLPMAALNTANVHQAEMIKCSSRGPSIAEPTRQRATDLLQPWHLRQQVVVCVYARLARPVVPRAPIFVDLPHVAAGQPYGFWADRHPARSYELLDLGVAQELRRPALEQALRTGPRLRERRCRRNNVSRYAREAAWRPHRGSLLDRRAAATHTPGQLD